MCCFYVLNRISIASLVKGKKLGGFSNNNVSVEYVVLCLAEICKFVNLFELFRHDEQRHHTHPVKKKTVSGVTNISNKQKKEEKQQHCPKMRRFELKCVIIICNGFTTI